MKYRDHQLLEDAYNKVLLKEGRDDQVGLSDSEYYDALDRVDDEKHSSERDADLDNGNNFRKFVELVANIDGKSIYISGTVYGTIKRIDTSFSHGFGIEKSEDFEKFVDGIDNLVVDFSDNDEQSPSLTPKSVGGLENYQKLIDRAKKLLIDEVED